MSDPVKLALIGAVVAIISGAIVAIVPGYFAYLSLKQSRKNSEKTDAVAQTVAAVEEKVGTVDAQVISSDVKLDKIGAATDGRLTTLTEELRVLREFEAERVKLMQDFMMRLAERPDSAIPIVQPPESKKG